MKHPLLSLVLIALFHIWAPVQAQSLKDAQPVFKSGNWTILRSIDPMTDKINCTGIYKSNYGVQLVSDTLYINVRGGIKSITLRFGENPAQPLRLAQEIEKAADAVVIDGNDFSQTLQTNRLRVRVLTLVRGVLTEDLDTTGIQAAVKNIQSGCPISPNTSSVPKPGITVESHCSVELIKRMKAAGITDQQITSACR